MKLIEPPKYKEVDFHGIKLTVPDGIEYIAVNADGEIVGFNDEPEVTWGNFWELHAGYDYFEQGLCLGCVDLEGMDWRETLIKV